MSKNDQSYFVQRAAEEMAAADDATCAAAASVHRELSLRYSLKVVQPGPDSTKEDDARPIGMPKRAPEARCDAALKKSASKR